MHARAVMASGIMASLVAGCAGAPTASDAAGQAASSWLMLTQVERRFGVFTDLPGASRSGDLATFPLVYVYAPGAVRYEGREVGYQEYSAVTVNCADNTVKLGVRTRHAPDGAVIMSDENAEPAEILRGTAADDAARVKCTGDAGAGVVIPAGADWIAAARAHILANDPPPR